MKLPLLVSILLFSVFAHGEAGETGKTCGKAWTALPSGTSIQNGKLMQSRTEKDRTRFQLKDFKGNLLKEYELPREADSILDMNSAGNGVVYYSKGKLYHFDPEKNREQEIDKKSDNQSLCEQPKSSILTACGSDSAQFAYDFKTQKQIDLPNVKKAQVQGQLVVYPESSNGSDLFSKVSLYDFSNSKKVSFDLPQSKYIQITSEKYIRITSQDSDSGDSHLVNVDGHWIKFDDTKSRRLTGVMSTGELLFGNFRHKTGKNVEISASNFNEFEVTTDIYDKTGTQKKSSVNGYYMDAQGRKAIIKISFPMSYSAFSENSFRDLASKKNVKPQLVSWVYPALSDSGTWGVQIDPNNHETSLVNMQTGSSIKLPYMSFAEVKEGEDGKNISVRTLPAGTTYVVNVDSRKVRLFESHAYTLFDNNFVNWFSWRNGIYETIQEVCFPDTIKVIDDDCGCLFRNADSGPLSQIQNLKDINDISLATLCQSSYVDSQQWDKITPPITKGELSTKQAILYLKRFQKMQGYDPQRHLAILTAILKSEMIEKYPALINETLKTLSVSQPALLRSLYNILKLDKRMPAHTSADINTVCRSKFDDDLLQGTVHNFIANATNFQQTKTTTEDWLVYKPFKADFQKLPKEQREALADSIGESLAQNAATFSDLNGIFQSKLYYFSKKFGMDLVGDTPKPATDLAIAVRNGQSIPVILGFGNLQNAKHPNTEDSLDSDSPFGFSFSPLDPISIPQGAKTGTTFTDKANWTYEGANYSAATKITVLEPLGNLISKEKSPNYSALRKNGKLTGMMIIGSNLSSLGGLVDNYLTYYQNQGFEFKDPKSVDAISFFKYSVQTGELGYLIKEAHSDGDEKNLFRANKFGKLFEGTLTKKDGSKEVIYLLAPDSTKTEDKLISNQEFGAWIRSRGKDQPLVYFNASCSSTRKVISEIAAAHSPNFTPIPTASSAMTFSDSEDNGTRQMIHAFREGKDYDGIRAALQKTATYQKGQDHYIFPDEKAYDDQIIKNLQMNLDVEVSVKDKSGKEVHIDESIDH